MQTVHEFAGRLSDDATLVLTTCPRVYSGVGSEPAGRAEASR
jgi:hypothetical protein